MTAVIHFRPLCGALNDDPFMYLLTIDECKILLDCGWNDSFDLRLLEPLKAIAHEINVVLISHPDLYHLGALPYALKHLGMTKAKIFGTIPVFALGQLCLYDIYESKRAGEDFSLFTLDDIDEAFDVKNAERFVQLKYSQHHNLTDEGRGIRITPYSSGHTVGGTIWKITKETEEIIYAVSYNQKKERHLNGTVLETLAKPSLLITDAHNSLYSHPPRKERDKQLIETIVSTLRTEGNVLLPCDTAGRVLELALLLDDYWQQSRLPYPLVLLNYTATSTVDAAKRQLEWMSDSVVQKFENSRSNPFDFNHLRQCTTFEAYTKAAVGPHVALASMPSLEFGFARTLFGNWASNPRNVVIFPQRSPAGTLAHTLMTRFAGVQRVPQQFPIRLRVPLEGKELEEFEHKKKEEKRRQEEIAEAERKREREENPDDDEDMDTAAEKRSLFIGTNDYFVPALETMPYPMFPHQEKIITWDEYGLSVQGEELAYAPAPAPDAYDPLGDTAAMDTSPGTELCGFACIHNGFILFRKEKEKEEKPTKCYTVDGVLTIACGIFYIDFEGRSDGQSIKNIISHVAPRRLVIVGAPEAETNDLLTYAQQQLKTARAILAPRVGEDIDVTSDTSVYPVKLKEALVKDLHWIEEGDTELAYVYGQFQVAAGAPALLAEIPAAAIPAHQAVYVGEVKLPEIRSVMQRASMQAELAQGILLVNRVLQIKKEEEKADGSYALHVEGILSEDYFKARDALYSQYKVL